MAFRDVEVYFLDLSVEHGGRQVTPYWAEITDVEVLVTNCQFRVEVMFGPGGYWLALHNDVCEDGEAQIVVKGQKEV